MTSSFEVILTAVRAFLNKPILSIAALAFLITVAIIDKKTMKIPNKVNLIAIMTSVGLTTVYGLALGTLPYDLMMCFTGACVGFLVIFIPAFIVNTPMGGDIKCYAVMGSFLGPYGIMGFACISCVIVLLGKCIRVALMKGNIFYKQMKIREKFAMGPWMLASYIILCGLSAAHTLL